MFQRKCSTKNFITSTILLRNDNQRTKNAAINPAIITFNNLPEYLRNIRESDKNLFRKFYMYV